MYSKENNKLVKWKPTKWERIFGSYSFDKIYRLYEEEKKKKTNDPVKKDGGWGAGSYGSEYRIQKKRGKNG